MAFSLAIRPFAAGFCGLVSLRGSAVVKCMYLSIADPSSWFTSTFSSLFSWPSSTLADLATSSCCLLISLAYSSCFFVAAFASFQEMYSQDVSSVAGVRRAFSS